MEIRQLQTFKTIAEVHGFIRAADVLGYAQSSVTAQIQGLEDEIGSPLFNRLGKKITLTEAGKRLLPYAHEILKMHDSAVAQAKEGEIPAGKIVIGAPESLAAYRLPSVLEKYRSLYPQVKIVLKPGLCRELIERVRRGELDIAFLLQQETIFSDLHSETLVREPMMLIASPKHRLTQHQHVRPSDLQGETILSTEPGCSYRELFESYLNQSGTPVNTDLEFWNIEAIKQCVMCGLGISYLPYITLKSEIRQNRLVALPWKDDIAPVTTQVIYHKSKWLSSALKEFFRLLRDQAQLWRKEVMLEDQLRLS
ncbi:LysR family transcriptional regulator [Sporolactobacillus sp. THM7-4]|nr:LysR family transcriptional regulator [Sporolactobacillus sp. THM7-4]